MDYQRKRLRLTGQESPESVLEKIRDLEGIVVNISCSPDEAPLFFSIEALHAILSGNVDALVLETLPTEDYNSLLAREIEAVIRTGDDLLKRLRDHFISDLKDAVIHCINQVENVTILLSCAVLKTPESILADQFVKLRHLQDQLGNACLRLQDTVQCMDILWYGILPILRNLLNEMRP